MAASHPASRIPYLAAPVSDAPLRSLRWGFGLVMAASVLRFWLNGWAADHFAPGRFAFRYYGLGWVPHPGAAGLQALMAAQLIGAMAILYRPLTRAGAGLFLLSFVWMQALDATWYLNHYYFAALVALGLAVVPGTAGGATRLTLGWFRLQTGILYVCAGLFKLEPDWILYALPLRIWLPASSSLPLLGPLLALPATAWLFSWGALLYDTAIPFLLMHRRTAGPAYALALLFHGLVGLLFDIGLFPWLMMAVAPVFFPQDWHEHFWNRMRDVGCWMLDAGQAAGTETGRRSRPLPEFPTSNLQHPTSRITHPASRILFLLYFAFQLLFPFRYLLYPGRVLWHEQGFRFSWRVMLMKKAGTASFYVLDRCTGRWGLVDNAAFLTQPQERMMATQPDFILQYAHFLARHYAARGLPRPAVRAEAYATLNGRPSRLLVDPQADLTQYTDGWSPYAFVQPSAKP